MWNPRPLLPDVLLVPGWQERSYWMFDLDGTLLDFAPSPDAVKVPSSLVSDLDTLSRLVSRRVALLSGRALSDLERLVPLPALQLAGNHGAEWRIGGRYGRALLDPTAEARWAEVRAWARELGQRYPALLVEDKGITITLHLRSLGADLKERVHDLVRRQLSVWPDVALRPAHLALELFLPALPNKGTLVRRLLEGLPSTVVPYVFGDDWTDEDSFRAVPEGVTVVVGSRRPTAARYALEGPAALRALLHRVVSAHPLSSR
ncbi:MAG: trehalose-phosphatase [Firmicutes bacterium]|nr:trehalose-phosphatase [Bacillota bacterium]